MIMILFKSLRKRTSTGSYYDEKSLTKCYWDGVIRLFLQAKKPDNPVPNGSPREASIPATTIVLPHLQHIKKSEVNPQRFTSDFEYFKNIFIILHQS